MENTVKIHYIIMKNIIDNNSRNHLKRNEIIIRNSKFFTTMNEK